MRILYANVIEQHAGWGAEWFINRAFQALGHSTHCIDFREHRFDLYSRFVNAPACDVFFLQRGDYFPKLLVRAVQVPRFFWASELVSRRRDQDRLLTSGLFDHIFLHTNQCVDTAVERGWVTREMVSVLMGGFDPDTYKPLPPSEKDIDILFAGSITNRRRKILEELGTKFKIYYPKGFIPTEEMVRLINRAKIVLNIHADKFPDTETRVFEVLGCGAFLLTEPLSSESPFNEEELALFRDVDDLHGKLEYYLEHEDERDKIARRGHETAVNEHTYTKRAQSVVSTMASYLPKEPVDRDLVKVDWRLRLYGASEPIQKQLWGPSKRTRSILKSIRKRRV